MKCEDCAKLIPVKSYGEPDYTCPKVGDGTWKTEALVAKVLIEGYVLECDEHVAKQ